ncbi:cell wall-binding repeat-containing protein, partial [uncultured Leifsonia sp.]|uniref:cell wall-binding repeat-containing protein n=1 Tax=uncultured Leifsonia sp. TaxID=340359 RepID=UPI0028D68CDD
AWGTMRVTIVGGTGSVSSGVQSALRYPVASARAAGADRYGTAAALARTLPRSSTGTAYLATGLGFADALTAAVLAGSSPAALLLTRAQCTPAPTLQGMLDTNVHTLVYVGGAANVSQGVTNFAC